MTQVQIQRFVAKWQRILGMERFDIYILWEAPPEGDDGFYDGSLADIRTHKHYDVARLRFGPMWPTWDAEKAEKTVIHELVHALHTPLDHCFDSVAGELNSRSTADAWWMHALETFTERLAQRLYEVSR